MGCGGSKDGTITPVESAQNSYDRRPKISVRIGPQVKKSDTPLKIIFIFGGPGSRKGRVVDDLVNSYGFRFLSGEDVILQELPRKVVNIAKIETVQDFKTLLEEDPSHITLDWLLHMVERRIERQGDVHSIYLIDLIPNLRFMLKCPSFVKECSTALQKFEQRYPISFALNMAIPADKVVQAKQVLCATPQLEEKMKETGGQGDEADTGRTQRRAAMFEKSVKSFMDYFANSQRLVTVDVTCGVADLIWYRVHELLCDLDFQPTRTVNTVTLFAFDDSDASDIDYDKYLMQKVELRTLVDNPMDSVENLLSELNTYINNHSKSEDSFVVFLSGTSVTKEQISQLNKKPIMFLGVQEGHIETYLPGSPKNYVPKAGSKKYKAVVSLENEVFLFPPHTSNEICTKIATYISVQRIL